MVKHRKADIMELRREFRGGSLAVAHGDDQWLPDGQDPEDIRRYVTEDSNITKLGLTAQQISIIKNADDKFFSRYKSLVLPGLTSSEDDGVHILSFSYNPGEYQPLGHFDASRSRELDLVVSTAGQVDGLPTSGTIKFLGQAINFINVSAGNAVLTYTA